MVSIAPSNFFVSRDTKRVSKGTPTAMAIQTKYYLSLSVIDSARKVSNVRLQIDPTEGAAWLAAADAPARALTDVGVFMTRIAAMSRGNVWAQGVYMEDVDDARAIPSEDAHIFNFDKFTVGYKAGLDNYVMTVPARQNTFDMNSDGVNVNTGAGATPAVTDFITSFEALIVPKNGQTPADIQYIKVNS